MSTALPPSPGAASFWQALIEYLYALEPWDFNRDLFGVILLCLVSRTGSLVIDVRRRTDVKETENYVRAMLDRLFGIRGVRLDLRREQEWYEGEDQVLLLTGLSKASHTSKLRVLDDLRDSSMALPAIWIRHQDERVPAWLIDMFTVSYVFDGGMEDPPDERPKIVPLSSQYLASLHDASQRVHIHPPLSIHLSNLQSATSHHPRLKTTLTARSQLAFPALIKAHRVLEGLTTYATAENARAVYPMLVSHRVSLRSKPEEIMWLLEGAAACPPSARLDPRRALRQTEGIISDILDSV